MIMSRENDLLVESREELIIDRDRQMARDDVVEHGPATAPRSTTCAARVHRGAGATKTERGIVPGLPKRRR